MTKKWDKPSLRQSWRLRSGEFFSHRNQIAQSIWTHLLSRPEFARAKKLGLYFALDWEFPLHLYVDDFNGQVAFPKTNPVSTTLRYFEVNDISRMKKGPFGLLEPNDGVDKEIVSWGNDDIILVPGLAFDRRGVRVGNGKGYYDRFLSSCQALKWGICHSAQITQDPIEENPTDVRMNGLCTEKGWLSC